MQIHTSRAFCFFGVGAWVVSLLLSAPVGAQTEPLEGIRENTPRVHALVNARIVQAPGQVIEKGTIVIRDGTLEAVGADVTPPPDARVWDYAGRTVYAGLIESYSQMGLAKPKRENQDERGRNNDAPEAGPKHWNPHVHPEWNATEHYKPKDADLQKLRELGFTAALVVPQDDVFCGAAALVSLRKGQANEQILKERVVQNVMLEAQGSFRDRTYPSSLMGAIALIRQTFLDADWYGKAHAAYRQQPQGQSKPEENLALEALQAAADGRQPVMFNVDHDLDLLRAVKVAQEFNLNAWIMGSGHEYRQLDAVKASGYPVILPVDFPEAPEVASPEEALEVSLMELSHWEAAPENPKYLQEAGVPFALTAANLKKASDFPGRVRQALERGLSAEAALAALTTTPARLMGAEAQLGTVERGKLAHLVVTDGPLFDEETKIRDVWVDGHRYEIEPSLEADPRGTWELTLRLPDDREQNLEVKITGKPKKFKGSALYDSVKVKVDQVKVDHKRLLLTFPGDSLGYDGMIRLSGGIEQNTLSGQGQLPDGTWLRWTATLKAEVEEEQGESKEEDESKVAVEPAKLPGSPPGAYGRIEPPAQLEHVLIRGATLWTCGPEGTLTDADMLVRRGKIAEIGQNLQAPSDAVIIDAAGKHVTPGLIDAHSHSGISEGVNEGTQAVTSEVRIGDVVDSYDIAFYRQLAGGLTAANQLHGSANPIGGQNSVIKLRWGASPEAMKIDDAIQGIKFALGENVKQSNWGDDFTTRYPQTRMGVEQIIRDRFKAALDYEKRWQEYNALRNKKGVIPPRRDLELEALLEILRGERLIHCHSYRQDEILMLVRVAEDFGFTIGTFQHVLEGYKVAEALASHGAGASAFSDWWAYKFEVYDAIPYNGVLMHNAGVVVSFNSDSNELARRMNLEAAKAVKYGGLSEEEALKFVTLNPARQLRIDHRVGSLEVGKDADFAIWSGHPLSTYTICEQTWIEGRKYFDRQADEELRQQVRAERARLIQKVLASRDKGKGEGPYEGRPTRN